ncbi:PLP-dependent aminotransferase family protein [Pseudomonas monteilii]|jgi:GntR family transcriptional regulator/MocR family aminotransferase
MILPLNVPTCQTPLYLQLYRRYQQQIVAGTLRPGDRLPSVRSLASELGVARGTVEAAFQLLASEGYLLARGAAGTFVSPLLQVASGDPCARPLRTPPAVTARPHDDASDEVRPFQLGLPALDAFPRKTWARLTGQAVRTQGKAGLRYPDPNGYAALRHAIARYLALSRGIACTAEQVYVTAGYQGALELICKALLQPGDTGWYEDPGYFIARRVLQQAGMHLVPVPVDSAGLDVAAAQRQAPDARFAVVTPTHQSPLGMALSLPRRQQLLAWASRCEGWVIEDDYDSEFRYHGRPLPALKSLDGNGRVLYTGTFSKVLFPGLRLAYLVVPSAFVTRFDETAACHGGPGSLVPQATVAAFMEQGHFARHLRTMRAVYATRRADLVDALDRTFGARLHIQAQAGGLHVTAYLKTLEADVTLAHQAQAQGLAVQALSQWYMGQPRQTGLLMGFTNLVSPEQTARAVECLERAWGA